MAAVREVSEITFHDLYEAYPDFHLDVAREQQQLLEHDVVILQHPFYWYSAPALLKEWLDLVLEYGFAYGPGGTRLHGKTLVSALTTGGAAQGYGRGGHNHFTIAELLTPFEQTARLCGMKWLSPFVVYGTIRLTDETEISRHATAYTQFVTALRDGRPTTERAGGT